MGEQIANSQGNSVTEDPADSRACFSSPVGMCSWWWFYITNMSHTCVQFFKFQRRGSVSTPSSTDFKNICLGTSLGGPVVKTPRCHCRGVQTRSPAGERRSHTLHGAAKKNNKKLFKSLSYLNRRKKSTHTHPLPTHQGLLLHSLSFSVRKARRKEILSIPFGIIGSRGKLSL